MHAAKSELQTRAERAAAMFAARARRPFVFEFVSIRTSLGVLGLLIAVALVSGCAGAVAQESKPNTVAEASPSGTPSPTVIVTPSPTPTPVPLEAGSTVSMHDLTWSEEADSVLFRMDFTEPLRSPNIHDSIREKRSFHVDFHGASGPREPAEWDLDTSFVRHVKRIFYPESGVLRLIFYTRDSAPLRLDLSGLGSGYRLTARLPSPPLPVARPRAGGVAQRWPAVVERMHFENVRLDIHASVAFTVKNIGLARPARAVDCRLLLCDPFDRVRWTGNFEVLESIRPGEPLAGSFAWKSWDTRETRWASAQSRHNVRAYVEVHSVLYEDGERIDYQPNTSDQVVALPEGAS